MAMYFCEIPTGDEFKASFDKARADGKSHLLMFRKTCNDVLAVRDDIYVIAVNDLSEIVPNLRSRNYENYFGVSTDLTAIYDVAQDLDYQNIFKNAAMPTSPANIYMPKQTAEELSNALKAYYAERNYGWALNAWNNQSWLKKLFIKPPVKPEILEQRAEPQLELTQ
jgi:hypothetical protein